jgi:hypothetical protein
LPPGSTASGQEQEKSRQQVNGSMISARFDKENLRKSLPHRFMYELMMATRQLGYYPNLLKPSTFNEKVMCRKLFAARPIYRTVADKYAVRNYVSQKIGKKYLVPMYEVIDRPGQIGFDKLPERCIMQPNNASGILFAVTNKWSLDPKIISDFIVNNLNNKYGIASNEHWYLKMKPHILIKRFLNHSEYIFPVDYRFHVFHGKILLIGVRGGYKEKKKSLVDSNWQPVDVQFGRACNHFFERPSFFPEMVEVVKELSRDFTFIRIDLLASDNRFYFGEITAAPHAGWKAFVPESWDRHFGAMWNFTEDLECYARETGRPLGEADTRSISKQGGVKIDAV